MHGIVAHNHRGMPLPRPGPGRRTLLWNALFLRRRVARVELLPVRESPRQLEAVAAEIHRDAVDRRLLQPGEVVPARSGALRRRDLREALERIVRRQERRPRSFPIFRRVGLLE